MLDIAQKIGDLPDFGQVLHVGSLPIVGRVFLAPMSGITDVTFRRIARRFGAAMVVSEMVACDDYAQGEREAVLRAQGQGVAPHVVQLAGCSPHWMGQAARLAEQSGAALIDINMGCPAKRVTGGYAGSALMRDLGVARALIEATVQAVRVPVSVKMRLGWDHDSLNAAELAHIAEDLGVAMVSVHGRTRQQFYKGSADWTAIRAVRDAVRIPVVANGDCRSLDDCHAMLRQSGADAIMVGRAALGQPWLVGGLSRALARAEPVQIPSRPTRMAAAIEHLQGLCSDFGALAGLRHARKHLNAYASMAGAPEALRLALVTTEDVSRAIAGLREIFGMEPVHTHEHEVEFA
ncbi:MAG: tRNA dihydrouridine synthase DusB [Hyphomicrobiales bacterium]|nr:tRNA dihydrouridine synthase DusB [Hyphomicrobiales bacterium]MDE2113284.1 tRNA dihydrouridine synthase DusB [Hyphomicrobiales bacterium]